MNDSANAGADGDEQVIVDLDTVREAEIAEIVLRRKRALDRIDAPDDIRESLVGLALSGGGVRSAAFSLGVLQALHRRGVLPFIDYLSTVSGGGYAGAYLSSAALQAESTNVDCAESESMFPIADSDGKQSPRMMKFIHGGQYLRKTWVFVNRYLIGLLLIWLVVFSGLVAMASLVTYLFRMLDYVAVQDWISALGFQGDVLRALFPTFVLFVFWAMFWAVSYFKFVRHASGTVARYVFYVLIASILVAIAALLGTGDISFSSGTSHTSFSSTFKALFFGAIAASLLPYLTPQRLIRSGTNPKNVAERYVFWLTTRALAYGVPFLFVAYFAVENISNYSDYREDRIFLSDIRSWDLTAPMWGQLVGRESKDGTGHVWESAADAVSCPLYEEEWQELTQGSAAIDKPAAGEEAKPGKSAQGPSVTPAQLGKLSIRDLEFLREILTKSPEQRRTRVNQERGANIADGDPLLKVPTNMLPMVDFQLQNKLALLLVDQELDHDKVRLGDGGILGDDGDINRPKEFAKVSFLSRWWHLFTYVGELVVADGEESTENLLAETVSARRKRRETQTRLVREMNQRLIRPEFYSTFLPDKVIANFMGSSEKPTPQLRAAFDQVSAFHPGLEPQAWGEKLLRIHKRAARVAQAAIVHTNTADMSHENDDPHSESLAHGPKPHPAIIKDADVRAVYAINRELLKAYYGNAISDRNKIYASTVLVEDQQTRWNWFVFSSIVFIIASALVDLNATSWHGFYSRRIASMWIEKTPGLAKGIPLAQLETTKVGRPYHLLTGAVHTRRIHDGAEYTTNRDRFLFSKLYCGSQSTHYAKTSRYLEGEYSLEDAVAISGAAVSPVQTDNPLIVGLLFLANIRLGQWVPNPGHDSWLPAALRRLVVTTPFTPLRFLYNRLQRLEKRSFCFVTDGGHYENLGIESLLKRRCRLIIASDAGQDSSFVFSDLTRLIRNVKRDDGILFIPMGKEEMPLALEKLVPDAATKLSRSHFVVVRIRYPEEGSPDGYLAYMKPTLNGDEPYELRQFHRTQDEFPHDPTSDQFYDADRFDSYRSLGLHIANELCNSMSGGDGGPLAQLDAPGFIKRFVDEYCVEPSGDDRSAISTSEPLMEEVCQILSELRSKDAAEHELAREKLEQLGTNSFAAMPDLLRALLEEQWSVTQYVKRLLYEYPLAALPHLVAVLEDVDDVQLQSVAADVICEYGRGPYEVLDTSSAIGPLINLSVGGQVATRAAAARALAVIGKDSAEARQALNRCKKDRSQKVRDACQV
ncbi:MAG: patatin-like phospholipase family protein [Planctomycetes bacterium]|nr:patatin-like phospholipase family protein [Planctomycetota bacterium]